MTSALPAPRKRRAYAARVPESQRRRELLDAALHLVVSKGHNAATMTAVATQAGVTKPVLYSVFANRADMLAELLRREQRGAARQLFTALPDDFGAGAPARRVAQLVEVADAVLAAVRQTPDRWYCVVVPMPDMPHQFITANERSKRLLVARIDAAIADLLPQLDSAIVANMLWSLLETAIRLTLTAPEQFSRNRFIATLHGALSLTTLDHNGLSPLQA